MESRFFDEKGGKIKFIYVLDDNFNVKNFMIILNLKINNAMSASN